MKRRRPSGQLEPMPRKKRRTIKKKSDNVKLGDYQLNRIYPSHRFSGVYAGTSVSQPVQPFKLKWQYSNVLNVNLGVSVAQTFRVNSLYDPDYTGIGDQPVGFDELSAFYSKYRVRACKIKFSIWNYYSGGNDTTNNLSSLIFAMVFRNHDQSTTLTTGTARAMRGTKFVPIVSADAGVTTITYYVTMRDYFGQDDIEDDDYAAATSTNPVNSAFVTLQAGSPSGVTSFSCGFRYHAMFTFYGEMTEPKPLAPS